MDSGIVVYNICIVSNVYLNGCDGVWFRRGEKNKLHLSPPYFRILSCNGKRLYLYVSLKTFLIKNEKEKFFPRKCGSYYATTKFRTGLSTKFQTGYYQYQKLISKLLLSDHLNFLLYHYVHVGLTISVRLIFFLYNHLKQWSEYRIFSITKF